MGERIELSVVVESFEPGEQRPVTPALDSELPVLPRWEQFADEQREAVLYLVGEVITNLADRMGEWVPRSFVADSNNRLDFTVSIDLADIENAVVLRAIEADQEMVQAMRRLSEMGADLE